MATEPKIVRAYRKTLANHDIEIADWEYTHSTNIRLTLKRGALTGTQVIGHSSTEVNKGWIAMAKRALNQAAQK